MGKMDLDNFVTGQTLQDLLITIKCPFNKIKLNGIYSDIEIKIILSCHMINTTLIEILKTFSKDEMKKFEDMVRSSYFNKDKPVIKLFEQIKKFHPEFKNIDIKRETIFGKMFPDKVFNYGTMKNLIYGLQKLCEKFIMYHEINKDTFEMKRSLINGFRNRELINLAEKNLKDLENNFLGNELTDNTHFKKMYLIDQLKNKQIFQSTKGNIHIKESMRAAYYEQLLHSIKNQKKYFIFDTLRSYNLIITNKNIINSKSPIEECDKFLKSFDEDEFEDITIKSEISFLKMNLGRITEEEFLELKKIVLKDLYEMNAGKDIIYAYSIFLLNYCRIKRRTDTMYLKYALEISKSLVLNKNFDDEGGYMNLILSRNIILIATELLEFKWCEDFLKLNLNRIHPDHRDSITFFYNAFKSFRLGDFNDSLVYVSKLNNEDIFNKSYIKELVIINYFELKYYDLLTEQLDSYKKFLVNNETFPDSYKVPSKNFINFVYKLYKAVSDKKTDLHYLKEEVNKEKDLLFKEWILKKIEEILPARKNVKC
ncbi:MAG: hypothetical protein ABI840_11410 [bacterium]